jgi:hypothetical protein
MMMMMMILMMMMICKNVTKQTRNMSEMPGWLQQALCNTIQMQQKGCVF